MRPNVKIIDCVKIIQKIIPELGQNKDELRSAAVPSLKHVILASADAGKPVTVPAGMHSYADLIRQGANRRQDERKERQNQMDGDTPVSIFYTSGTTGQPKAATLTNFAL